MNKYLYHITTKASLKNIMTQGLIPMIGDRSKIVGENEKYIFLCERKDLPYWQILLKHTVILRVDKNQLDLKSIENVKYSYYNEYLYSKTIPASALKQIYVSKPKITHMKNLCKSVIWSINNLVLTTVKYYETNDNERKASYGRYLKDLYPSTLYIIDCLRYDCMDTPELRAYITDIGESGEYTFLDKFKGSETRLYQQMTNYDVDDFTQHIQRLYDYIINNFSECLDLDTGGWTG